MLLLGLHFYDERNYLSWHKTHSGLWGDISFCQVLAAQTWGPEVPRAHTKGPSRWYFSLELWRHRQEDLRFSLASHPNLIVEPQANDRSCLKRQGGQILRHDTQGRLSSGLYMHTHLLLPNTHIPYTHACAHRHTHTHLKELSTWSVREIIKQRK